MSNRCDLLNVGVMTGNNVSHSNRKTRRRFLPNLKAVSLESEVLGVNVNLKIASSTLRTVNKYGNLDLFLVNYRFNKLTPLAQKIRNKIKKKIADSDKLAELTIKTPKKVKQKES